MIRLILVAGLIFCLTLADAAERISPRLAQRLIVVMELAADDPDQALEDLDNILESRRMTPSDKGFVAFM